MGLTYLDVSLRRVGQESNNRLDQEFYFAQQLFEEFISTFEKTELLGVCVSEVRNGLDISKDLYSYGVNTGVLYLSVNQIAGGIGNKIRLDDATFLDIDPDRAQVVVSAGDVVVTRSGTPGVAWFASEDFVEGWDAIIPSGYTQRLKVKEDIIAPEFLAMYLNMPPVRMLTRAYACGKDQFNLSQQYLKNVPVPLLSEERQNALVDQTSRFQERLEAVHQVMNSLLVLRDIKGMELLQEKSMIDDLGFSDSLRSLSVPDYEHEHLNNWELPKRRQSD
jgi:hypothetical protein